MQVRGLAVLFLLAIPALAQTCRLSVAGLNRDRRVEGDVSAECPNNPLHTAPFGNWGVTSNFGVKRDSHQFDGWCHDTRVCDNNGACRNVCRDGWYEWNSCTTDARYRAPNCTLYNARDCTAQASTQGINVHGTQTVEIPVRCPIDTDNDGAADAGGCADVRSYTHSRNFMSLYELDPLTGDDLVQTLYFPPTPVSLRCTPAGCPAAGSEWRPADGVESPASPQRVFAEMAMVVNSGVFVDPNGACRVLVTVARSASAASYAPAIAPGSLAALFGSNLAPEIVASDGSPPMILGGVQVVLTDSLAVRRRASLLYVSPRQINWVAPAGLAPGEAAITVESESGALRAIATARVEPVAPGLFTADGSGAGRPAALATLVHADGSRTVVPAAEPVAVSGAQDAVLELFGTGFRGAADKIEVRIGGVRAAVLYAGEQGSFPGLDQVNVRLPRPYPNGQVALELTADGVRANPVTLDLR